MRPSTKNLCLLETSVPNQDRATTKTDGILMREGFSQAPSGSPACSGDTIRNCIPGTLQRWHELRMVSPLAALTGPPHHEQPKTARVGRAAALSAAGLSGCHAS